MYAHYKSIIRVNNLKGQLKLRKIQTRKTLRHFNYLAEGKQNLRKLGVLASTVTIVGTAMAPAANAMADALLSEEVITEQIVEANDNAEVIEEVEKNVEVTEEVDRSENTAVSEAAEVPLLPVDEVLNDSIQSNSPVQALEDVTQAVTKQSMTILGDVQATWDASTGTVTLDGGKITDSAFWGWGAIPNDEIKKVVFTNPVDGGKDLGYLFNDFINLSSIENLNKLDTTNAENMENMFSGLDSLTSIDLSAFNTSKVADMSFMFYDSPSLTHLDLSSFDTSSVVYMQGMFSSANNLQSVELSSFDTSKVQMMDSMFSYTNIENLDITHFDTSNVAGMSGMFSGIPAKTLNLSNFDTSNVDTMSWMFADTVLESIDLSNFDTSKVIDMGGMFLRNKNLTALDLSSFDMISVKDKGSMLADMSRLVEIKLGDKTDISGESRLPESYYLSSDLPKYSTAWTRDSDAMNVPNSEELIALSGTQGKATGTWKRVLAQAIVNVKDSEISEGDTWQPEDNFVNAKNKYGYDVWFDSIKVTGTVNTKVPGTYKVTYSYDGVSAEATIVVKALPNHTSVQVKDSEMYAGESWEAKDNFVSATDKNGDPVPFDEIQVSGSVDTKVPGKYTVTYTYNGVSSEASITVKAKPVTGNDNYKETYSGQTKSVALSSMFDLAEGMEMSDFEFNIQPAPEAIADIEMDLSEDGQSLIFKNANVGQYKVIAEHKESDQTVESTLTITPKALTTQNISVDRLWDGSSDFTLSAEDVADLTLEGVIADEDVTLTLEGRTGQHTVDGKSSFEVGKGQLTLDKEQELLAGEHVNNYTLTHPTILSEIIELEDEGEENVNEGSDNNTDNVDTSDKNQTHNPEKTPQSEEKAPVAKEQPAQDKKVSQQRLPETGEAATGLGSIFGLSLIALAFGLKKKL